MRGRRVGMLVACAALGGPVGARGPRWADAVPIAAVRADTARVDAVRADTLRADTTVRTDSVRVETVRTDTARADTARTVPRRVDTATVDLAALSDTAWREGRRAADRPNTFGRGTLAFLGGMPLGFVGPLVPFAFREPAVLIPAAVGAGLVTLAAAGAADPPAAGAAQAAARGPLYARVYRDAYDERLRARRRRAALIGGASGAAVGVGLLVFVISALAHLD